MYRTAKLLFLGSIVGLGFTGTSMAEPTRYEACTTGISAAGVIDNLDVYGTGPEILGETEDLIIDRNGRVLAVRAEVGSLWGTNETDISIPWQSVDVGETWVRTPLLDENVEDFTPLSDEDIEQRILLGDRDSLGADMFYASDLIGDVATTRDGPADRVSFGVVNDLLIDVDKIGAVIIAPDAGLGLAETYAIPFADYVDGSWNPGSDAFELNFQKDEVEQIEAFEC